MISDKEVQETFYNTMLDIMFTGELAGQNPQFVKYNLTEPTLKTGFIKAIVIDTFQMVICSSKFRVLENGVATLEVPSIKGNIMTPQNVSPLYQNLFAALVMQYQSGSPEMLSSIVDSTMRLATFSTMIESVVRFYLNGITEQYANTTPSAPNLIPVTIDGVRETFYNIMVNQYLDTGLIPKEDLESCESYIFTALSAYVVFAVIITQKSIKGVRLCNGSIVTRTNCPPQVKPLFDALLKIKEEIEDMHFTTQEETHILQTISSKQNSGSSVSPHIGAITGKITGIAIQISQIQHFKQVIGDVIGFLMQVS